MLPGGSCRRGRPVWTDKLLLKLVMMAMTMVVGRLVGPSSRVVDGQTGWRNPFVKQPSTGHFGRRDQKCCAFANARGWLFDGVDCIRMYNLATLEMQVGNCNCRGGTRTWQHSVLRAKQWCCNSSGWRRGFPWFTEGGIAHI